MVEAVVPTVAGAAKEDTMIEAGKKKAYHHGDLRNAIIAEATARARESGDKAIVLREIAPQIGVSATAAYRHFANRQQLVEEVAAQGFVAMGARLSELEPADTADPVLAPYVDLRNAAIAMVRFSVAEPAWARMMLENLGNSTTVAERAMVITDIMQGIVDRGVEEGTFVQGLHLAGQRALWAAIDGLSAQAMFNVHPMGTPEAAAAVARTVDLCMTDMLTEQALRARTEVELPPGSLVDAQS